MTICLGCVPSLRGGSRPVSELRNPSALRGHILACGTHATLNQRTALAWFWLGGHVGRVRMSGNKSYLVGCESFSSERALCAEPFDADMLDHAGGRRFRPIASGSWPTKLTHCVGPTPRIQLWQKRGHRGHGQNSRHPKLSLNAGTIRGMF